LITLLKSGNVYDPQNKIFNVKKDIYIEDGQIIDKKSITSKIDKVIDCNNKIVMPRVKGYAYAYWW
jgi:Formylmethanofuran dehydrogenase subunit A